MARHPTIFAFVECNDCRRALESSLGHRGSACHADTSVLRLGRKFLLVALFAPDRWLPGPAAHSHFAIPPDEKVNLRIRSDHKWPERVVFDTAHSGMPLATEFGPELDAVPNQDLAQAEQRNPLDAFAAMDGAQTTSTATNDKASAIRAKPRPPGPRMSSTAKSD